MVEYLPIVFLSLLEQRIARAKLDGHAGTNIGASGGFPNSAAVNAEITFDRMVIGGIISHGTIRAGDDAFAATCATHLVNPHHPGDRVLLDGFRRNRTSPKAGGPFTMLASEGQEIEAGAGRVTDPKYAVTVFSRAEAVLHLARHLTTLAADTTFHIDHQSQALSIAFVLLCHCVTMP